MAAGDPVATTLALAEGTALAVAGGAEPIALATAVGVAGSGVAVAAANVGVAAACVPIAVGATLGAVVAAGAAQATATSPRASNETNLLCLTAILLYVH